MSSDKSGRHSRGRRHWWTVFFIFLGLVLLAVAAWRIAENTFEARLQARLDEYRRLGQPATLADLKPAPVDPSDNAALTLREAQRLIVLDSRQEFVAHRPDPRWVQQQPQMLAEIVRINAPAIQKAHQARGMKGVDWGLDYSSFDALTSSTIGLSGTKSLCYLLASTAHWEAQTGQDSESIACVRDILRTSQMVAWIPQTVADLAHIAIASLACYTVEGALPHWDLNNAQTREQAEALLKELLDESDFFAAGQQMWWGERAMSVDLTTGSLKMAPRRPDIGWLYVPVIRHDLLRDMDDSTAMAEAMTQPTYPQAAAMIPRSHPPGSIRKLLWPLLSIGSDRTPLGPQLRYFALAERRLAALGLAMAMFRADHGRGATDLSQLVPRYLPAVPADPFTAEGAPLRLAGDEPARLYSVGVDGVDDGGRESKRTLDSGDVVFYLAAGRKREPLEPIPGDTPETGAASAPATELSGPLDDFPPQQ